MKSLENAALAVKEVPFLPRETIDARFNLNGLAQAAHSIIRVDGADKRSKEREIFNAFASGARCLDLPAMPIACGAPPIEEPHMTSGVRKTIEKKRYLSRYRVDAGRPHIGIADAEVCAECRAAKQCVAASFATNSTTSTGTTRAAVSAFSTNSASGAARGRRRAGDRRRA